MLTRISLRDESGVVLVFTAVLLLVLMGFAALAVDLGNAWSNDQRVQTATDVASVGALQVIPHTFRDGYTGNPPEGGAETVAGTEALDLITVNNAVPGAVDVDLALDGGNVSVAATATIDSDNAFARTIGAGAAVTVDGAARAEIFANQPTVDLLPLGFDDPTNPFRCISDPALGPSGCERAADPQPSTDLQIIAMRQRRTGCTDLEETMQRNLQNGADHLVDLAATGIRDEKEACDDGHPLTMPSTSRLVPIARGDFSLYVTSGLGGRLSGDATELWDRLLPGLPGACDRIAIQALTDVQEQSALMAECLASGNAEFQSGLVRSPRLVWAIDTAPGGSGVVYGDYVLAWINTVIQYDSATNTFTDSITPSGSLVGFTVFILDQSMLNETIRWDPGGIDNLEFQLVD